MNGDEGKKKEMDFDTGWSIMDYRPVFWQELMV